MCCRNQGFSLTELMVVIAIVGLLSIVAVPSYKNYMARTTVVSSLQLADAVKMRVTEYYSLNGSFPTAESFALNTPTSDLDYVGWLPVWSSIEIWFSASSGIPGADPGGILLLIPTYNVGTGTVEWVCTSHHQARIPCDLLPPICQSPNPYGDSCT